MCRKEEGFIEILKTGEYFMKLKKGDMIILVFVLLAAVSYFSVKSIYKDKDDKAIVIYVEGSQYEKFYMKDITEDKHIHIDLDKGKFIDINVSKDGVFVSDVVCPDRICVKTGLINKVGQSIVCLPNKVQIYIEGSTIPDVDNVSF